MKIKAVIFNHNQLDTAHQLYCALQPHMDTTLIDSGSDKDQISSLTAHAFDNLYWTGCWNKSWELFDDYDVIWGIGGDCELRTEPAWIKRAIESAYPFGVWSPAICGRVADYMKIQPDSLVRVNFIEGIAIAISKSLWQKAGAFDRKNRIGWGQDIIMCHRSRELGMSNLIDGRVQLFHPPSYQYNHTSARLQMMAAIRKVFGDGWQAFANSLSSCDSAEANTIDVLVDAIHLQESHCLPNVQEIDS
jgi:hypothetical protein